MNIRTATEHDIDSISQIYSKCFVNERDHLVWITSSFNSFPRGVYYVVEQQGVIAGYILWCVKNGFKKPLSLNLNRLLWTLNMAVLD
jgi:L-amino acid N-acyltransferase YncA